MFLAGEMLSASSSILPAPGSYRSGALNDPHYVLPSREHAAGCGEQVGESQTHAGELCSGFCCTVGHIPTAQECTWDYLSSLQIDKAWIFFFVRGIPKMNFNKWAKLFLQV